MALGIALVPVAIIVAIVAIVFALKVLKWSMKKILLTIQVLLAAYVGLTFILGLFGIQTIPDVRGTPVAAAIAVIALALVAIISAISDCGCCKTEKK